MKSLIVLLTLLVGSYAMAEETLVYTGSGEFRRGFGPEYGYFTYKKKKGIAKVRVYSQGPNFCRGGSHDPADCDYLDEIRDHHVEGLYFDRGVGKRGAVIYDSGEEKVVCATHRFFWGPKETGLCRIEVVDAGRRNAYTVRLYVDL